MRAWLVVTLVLVALVLGTSFAHVLEWPAKLQYDGPLYTRLHTTLYIYWGPPSLTGFVEPAAIVAVLVLAALLRHERPAFPLAALAAGALLLAFPVIFFWRVEPANAAFRAAALAGTVPKDWTAWRARWETGHALRFVLHLVAFVLLASAATQLGGHPDAPPNHRDPRAT
jgi:hypothetical protein